ncbi:MAG: hypothetical protein COB17_04010 [Sulfurimonas sp.]|nr:MAG: hypothetical protein COB17_04010 [Sulfurimonas sp.]
MLFNSYEFIFLFLVPVLVGWFLLLRSDGRFQIKFGMTGRKVGMTSGKVGMTSGKVGMTSLSIYYLIIVSIIFYAQWNLEHLFILLFSIFINYGFARFQIKFGMTGCKFGMTKERHPELDSGSTTIRHPELDSGSKKKVILITIIVLNLLPLIYYKYSNFFNMTDYSIVLPLAISFFTFQQIAFQVDLYRGKIKIPNQVWNDGEGQVWNDGEGQVWNDGVCHPELDSGSNEIPSQAWNDGAQVWNDGGAQVWNDKNSGSLPFKNYLFFILFFPQLVAGPIVHYNELIPQLKKPEWLKFNLEYFNIGILLFSIGLFKKVVLADNLAPIANASFSSLSSLSTYDAWIGLFAYSFQIYFDFSGYADMAIGLALLFGLRLPVNFTSPYKSRNIVEFWRNWHITLSSFLKEHLYIPLGGNRLGMGRSVVNLLITMTIGGIWHGAGWTFVLWGFLHGVFLGIVHLFGKFCRFQIKFGMTWQKFGMTGLLFGMMKERHPELSSGSKTKERHPELDSESKTKERHPELDSESKTKERHPELDSESKTKKRHPELDSGSRVLRYISIFITFLVVTLLWVLFRAENFGDAMVYYGVLFEIPNQVWNDGVVVWNGGVAVWNGGVAVWNDGVAVWNDGVAVWNDLVVWNDWTVILNLIQDLKKEYIILLAFIIVWFLPNSLEFTGYINEKKKLNVYHAFFGALLFFISLKVMANTPAMTFVYFNF